MHRSIFKLKYCSPKAFLVQHSHTQQQVDVDLFENVKKKLNN